MYQKIKNAIVILLIFSVAFLVFRLAEYRETSRLLFTIGSILRNESMNANTYALSKAVSDIESLGLIDCAKVYELEGRGRLFYDTSSSSSCQLHGLAGKIRSREMEITSINGSKLRVVIQPSIDIAKIILELTIYLAVLMALRSIAHSNARNKMLNEAKLKALELEKQMMVDQAKQIRHDVASPLTAISTIVKYIPNLNPELKSVLDMAVSRTHALFNELNNNTRQLQKEMVNTGINTILKNIVTEKRCSWPPNVSISLNDAKTTNTFIDVDMLDLSVVLSNILNNAFEACDTTPNPQIDLNTRLSSSYVVIEISDNGKGIRAEDLPRIGEKGFSYNKGNLKLSGSGLGVYSAIQSIKSWSGDFRISSIEGAGTTVRILIPRK